jgi:hypothetical protein
MIEGGFVSRFCIVLFACLVSGCASLTTGQNQPVSIETPQCPQASCVLTNNDGKFFVDRTPGTTMVNKSCSELAIRCSKPGFPDYFDEISAGFQAMTTGNILIGGLIGLGVDAATGAACKYPSSIIVDMVCPNRGAASTAADDSGIPAYVWDAAFEHRCGGLSLLEQTDSDSTYYSAICQAEPRVVACAGEDCQVVETDSSVLPDEIGLEDSNRSAGESDDARRNDDVMMGEGNDL